MTADANKVAPLRPKRPCPECGKPSDRASFPFCSSRCKSVDLNRWLTGSYVIPGDPLVDDDDDYDRPSPADPSDA